MTPDSTTPQNGRARILVTDDRPEVLRLVDRALGGEYECEFAGGVVEAREKLATIGFDLALCDIQMPGESGLVLVEEIVRTAPRWRWCSSPGSMTRRWPKGPSRWGRTGTW